jgi:hypothetical protein
LIGILIGWDNSCLGFYYIVYIPLALGEGVLPFHLSPMGKVSLGVKEEE